MRGSFTGAYRDKRGWLDSARDGTIFMDEVGEMSLRMQALLLRFLETGEIQRVGSEQLQTASNVRVIAATNQNLVERVADRSFREDLYYRLNVIHVVIPPLRVRRDDVAPLVMHFLNVFCQAHGIAPPALTEEALETLTLYEWPGNVRELRNIVERLVTRKREGAIARVDLPPDVSFRGVASVQAAKQPLRPSTVDVLYERMTVAGDSFWSVVYGPFMSRDLTREDLRTIVARGLNETRGSYKGLVDLFNLATDDYKRFLSVLRKHECRMPFQPFRALPSLRAPTSSRSH